MAKVERREARVGLIVGFGAEWLLLWETDALAGGRHVWEPERDVESVITRTRRTLDVVRVYRDAPAQQIVENLYYAVRAFSRNEPQVDDITATVIKVGGQA